MSNIIVVLNEGRIGDQNQLYGIVEALKSQSPNLSIKYTPHNELKPLKEIINNTCRDNYKKLTILTSGLEGINVINEIADELCPNIVMLNTAHMIFKKHPSILGKANLIALPKHSIDNDFLKHASEKKTEIIQTVGVSHNSTPTIIKQEYEKYAKEFRWLQGKDKIAMIVLGGDAPTSEGKIKFYTAEEAAKRADLIGQFCKKGNYSLMIFNGPRTGQYDHTTSNKNEWVHKNEKLDVTTSAFIERLQKYMDPSQFKLYNFSHISPSPYKAGFWVVKNAKEGLCFLPGESTSMISEGNDNLPNRTIIMHNGAMNETHIKHVKSQVDAGRTILFTPGFIEASVMPKIDFTSRAKPASAKIADILLKKYLSVK